MSDIKFGSEVYTWFMDGYGEGNKNQLGHMIKTVRKSWIQRHRANGSRAL